MIDLEQVKRSKEKSDKKDKGNPDNSKIFMGEDLERISYHLYDFDKE